MNNVVALIPARGGSKAVYKKNIKLLDGVPLIEYSIRTAIQNSNCDRVIVSTDDQEIAKISKKAGAEVPFIRPASLAEDNTADKPVIEHALTWLEKHEKFKPDAILFLRPTTPFKTTQIIDQCLDSFWQNNDTSSVRTVNKAEGVNHPYWMFKDEDGYLAPFVDGIKLSEYYQRQLLPSCYQLNGVVDVLKPEIVFGNKNMYGEQVRFVEIDAINAVDIDTQLDFNFAEFILQKGTKY